MYYKVVRPFNGSLLSCSIDPSTALTYSADQWTEPVIPGSRIFVFDSLANADYFRSFGQVIYSCEAEDLIPLANRSFELTDRHIRAFWDGTLHNYNLAQAPIGTLGAKRVKLIEEIRR